LTVFCEEWYKLALYIDFTKENAFLFLPLHRCLALEPCRYGVVMTDSDIVTWFCNVVFQYKVRSFAISTRNNFTTAFSNKLKNGGILDILTKKDLSSDITIGYWCSARSIHVSQYGQLGSHYQ
jgi:hypothetical protein